MTQYIEAASVLHLTECISQGILSSASGEARLIEPGNLGRNPRCQPTNWGCDLDGLAYGSGKQVPTVTYRPPDAEGGF